MAEDEYDLSGTGVGVVDADAVLGADRVCPGDTVIAMASSGLHSNGYSLARKVLLEEGRLTLDAVPEALGRPLVDELLEPTRIYAKDCLALAAEVGAHAFAHVTGGGLAGNLARVLPPTLDAELDRTTWSPPPVFDLIAGTGAVPLSDMERTFNLGVGMVAVVPADRETDALDLLQSRRVPSWTAGRTAPGAGSVRLSGRYGGAAASWR
jgi:phosphoribosylformylglycinamidine cyclo-ligase